MKLTVTYHFIYKFFLLVILSSVFAGCQPAGYDQKVNDLARQGNALLEQEETVRSEWKAEFLKHFTPENRAKFPANREELRPHAENQIRLLERMQTLSDSAAEKFEQARGISKNDKEARFTGLIAASVRKSTESYQLFKEQMNLVLDDEIKDSGTFEARFSDLTQRISAKSKESDELKAEAEKVLGK